MTFTPPPPGHGYAPYPTPTNSLAIVALVLGIVLPPGGIIAGHIALGQIRRTGEQGRGMALAGLIVGYCLTGLIVGSLLLAVLFSLLPFLFLLLFAGATAGGGYGGEFSTTALTLLV